MARITIFCVGLAVAMAACERSAPGRQATLTGCLGRGDVVGTYVLTIPAVSGTPGATGTTGTTGPDWSIGRSYRVDAATDVDLSQYVGKRVAINGRLEDTAARNEYTESPNARIEAERNRSAIGTTGQTSGAPPTEVFHASSVRTVAETCAGP